VQTVTGNSIHYVLAPNGHPIDGLPGLYGPPAFLRELERVRDVSHRYMTAADFKVRQNLLAEYHRHRLEELRDDWSKDLAAIGLQAAQVNQTLDDKASADELDKSITDASDETWGKIAKLHSGDAQLDAASVALVEQKFPTAKQAAKLAISKRFVESPLLKMIREFNITAALDTVRNEYLLHRQLHQWFASEAIYSVDGLNSRVYAQLFLTPDADPWMGLMSEGVYSALENGGVVQSASR
jgi:hypothetical protein